MSGEERCQSEESIYIPNRLIKANPIVMKASEISNKAFVKLQDECRYLASAVHRR